MRYIMLIYDNEGAMKGRSKEEISAVMGEWFKYTDDLQKSGKMLGGEALHPTCAATTVQVQREKTLTTDGPFAETKEQLGGFYVIKADDIDEAIEWAAKMPHMAHGGSVEVRPIMEFENR
jgi:hypothetical protein